MDKKLIAKAWESYRLAVVPHDAGAVQVKETKLAFYGGAGALLAAIFDNIGSTVETTPKDLEVMIGIREELLAWAEKAKREAEGEATAL